MKRYHLIPMLGLQLFAEGGGADGGTGVTASDAGMQTGVTAPDAGVQQTAAGQVDRRAEFEKLIKGDYKDVYGQMVQETVRSRLKGQKDTVDRYNALSPALSLLAQKYGVEPGDTAGLVRAIEDDNAYYENEAARQGMDVEHFKKLEQVRRKNAMLQAQIDGQKQREHAARQYSQWMQQAEQAKTIYPGLDLDAEVKNPQFMRLLKSGVDVGSAYLVIHRDEVIPAAMRYTAEQVEKGLANKIASGADRPSENGVGSPATATVTNDTSAMTRKARAEINRRVLNGETISFG